MLISNGLSNFYQHHVQDVTTHTLSNHNTYCFTTDLTANRLDNSRGHSLDNIEPCCQKCNSILSNREGYDKKGVEPSDKAKKKKRS